MTILRLPGQPERFKVFLRDPDKKSYLKCLYEFLILSIKKKEIAYYYFKHFYKKQIVNIHDYLGTKERAKIHSEERQSYELTSILSNKLNFAIYFEKFGFKTPLLITYNFKNRFYYKNRIYHIYTENELRGFFLKVLKDNNLNSLFIRPLSALGGKGCLKLTLDNLGKTLALHTDQLLKGDHIMTEVIKQHPKIANIHNASVNTLRMLTLIGEKGKPELISVFMRFGADDKIVDNLSSGGFFVGVDIQEGNLKKNGWREQLVNQGELIEKHPLSGIKLEGFKIPFFKEACSMVLEATKYLPNTLIGWDVAIQEGGPTLIEGNHDPGLVASDLANEGLLKNKNFRDFVKSVKEKT